MATHPIYPGDDSVKCWKRPCAAPADEVGTCEAAARQIGVAPQSTWTEPSWGTYGWVCSAHTRVLDERYAPELIAASGAQLAAEGREFFATYGEESGEMPRLSQRTLALDSLNSDV